MTAYRNRYKCVCGFTSEAPCREPLSEGHRHPSCREQHKTKEVVWKQVYAQFTDVPCYLSSPFSVWIRVYHTVALQLLIFNLYHHYRTFVSRQLNKTKTMVEKKTSVKIPNKQLQKCPTPIGFKPPRCENKLFRLWVWFGKVCANNSQWVPMFSVLQVWETYLLFWL